MKHLKNIINELAKRLGKEEINPKEGAEWTKKDKQDFQNWLVLYMSNKEAREELMLGAPSQTATLKRKKIFAKVFVERFTNWINVIN